MSDLPGCGHWKPKHGVGPYCGNCGFHEREHRDTHPYTRAHPMISPAEHISSGEQQRELPKQSVQLIRDTLQDMRKHGLTGGLPQEHAFTLLEEIERLTREKDTAERDYDCAELRAENERLKTAKTNLLAALAAKQANIDALMLEFCPGEMSAEQKVEWAKHQVAPPTWHCRCGAANTGERCSNCRLTADESDAADRQVNRRLIGRHGRP